MTAESDEPAIGIARMGQADAKVVNREEGRTIRRFACFVTDNPNPTGRHQTRSDLVGKIETFVERERRNECGIDLAVGRTRSIGKKSLECSPDFDGVSADPDTASRVDTPLDRGQRGFPWVQHDSSSNRCPPEPPCLLGRLGFTSSAVTRPTTTLPLSTVKPVGSARNDGSDTVQRDLRRAPYEPPRFHTLGIVR